MAELPSINQVVEDLRKEFLTATSWDKVSHHDFLSSMLMAPSIDMALANGSISLVEELSLNKKARNFSKGGFFLKQDPVVKIVSHLVKQFDEWEERLYQGLRRILNILILPSNGHGQLGEGIFITMMNTSYLMIKLVETFFLPEGEEIINEERSIAQQEYSKLVSIGDKLELSHSPIFKEFLSTFQIK